MTTPHIFLATPMYGGQCNGGYTYSVLKLQAALAEKGWSFSYIYSINDALIQRARNYLTYRFLESEATHLLFIDSDVIFRPEDVIKMIEADVDVICGMYPKKTIRWDRIFSYPKEVVRDNLSVISSEYVFNVLDGESTSVTTESGLVPVKHSGTGYMLIKRSVFETLKKYVTTYTDSYYDDSFGKILHNFFPVEIKDDQLMSEDWSFCNLWRTHNNRVYLATWAQAQHVGTYIFG